MATSMGQHCGTWQDEFHVRHGVLKLSTHGAHHVDF
ncbi:hypothetical protein PF003_g10631 [Phytophthora fragariae]|nr:hypothetical protein PF003_g10631 [Phytophthora fragariae]